MVGQYRVGAGSDDPLVPMAAETEIALRELVDLLAELAFEHARADEPGLHYLREKIFSLTLCAQSACSTVATSALLPLSDRLGQ